MFKKLNQKKYEPIDFVIAWVDGNDPNWQAEKATYANNPLGDNRDIRFRDWDNLQYWFRAVEQYAPWVNKIHFITWGHLPNWLNVDHPKLHIVKHEDYIPAKYLPTLNSHTIELNIHRIPGLAEQFVYFNDDMFLNAPVEPTDFFKNGLPRDIFAQNAIYFGPDSVGAINGNNICIINKYFPKKQAFLKNWNKWFIPTYGVHNLVRTVLLIPWPWFPGLLYAHTTTNLLKKTLKIVWEKEYHILDQTCSCRFRQQTNVNQWLFKYWQLADGTFYPLSNYFSHCFHIKDNVSSACQAIRQARYKVICINDTAKTQNFEQLSEQVKRTFSTKFPQKSFYEL